MNLETALGIFGLLTLDGVSANTLKTKYRTLAKEKHPDGGLGTSEDFVKLREAFLYLRDRVGQDTPDSSSKDLKTLSKEEILTKYYKDTQSYQLKLETLSESFQEQTEIIENIREKVQGVVTEFETKKKSLHEELEREVMKLEKNYTRSFIKKILFFLPKMSEQEFWDLYERQVQKYAQKHTEMDVEFLREMLSAYGDGLNDISNTIEKI